MNFPTKEIKEFKQFVGIYASQKPVTGLNTNSTTPCNMAACYFTETRVEACNFNKKELSHR